MIEFKGEVSDKIKTQVIKKRDRLIGTCGLIFTILSFICTLIFCIVGWNYIEILIFSCIILLFSIYFLIAPQSGTTMRFRWNWIVTIDDEMIKQELIGSSTQIKIKPLSKIKKVIDYGEYYCLIYADISNCFICQKNLITQGTIEEFEEIFKDKIVKKSEK